jgi:hypothetical protein
MPKNFSTNNASGKRKASDFYETPYSLTRLFLQQEAFSGVTLEPACGNLAICSLLDEFNLAYDNYDIQDPWKVNFLNESNLYDNVITNPPFSLALEFIQKSKQISKAKIAMLLPLSYLHGKERFDKVWQDTAFPLKKIYVFTRYPLLGEPLRLDGKHNTGMMVYAWYVWEKSYIGDPTISWLDNNPFILKN